MSVYAKRVYFNDQLKARKSVNGFYSTWDANSGINTSGNICLQWQNIQSLSLKHIMTDFMINLSFEVAFNAANDDAVVGKKVFLNKDINNAFETNVALSGGLSRTNYGVICNLFKNYSERYKSVPDLDKQDLYVYEGGTNTTIADDKRGVKITAKNTASTFTVSTSVPLYHEWLLGPLGGITGLTIIINIANNLINIIDTNATLSHIKDVVVTCRKASITYCNYEQTSDSFNLLIPHFDVFFTEASNSTDIQTRSTESCPNSVFQFITQNPAGLGNTAAGIPKLLKKPLLIKSLTATVNGNANAFNTKEPMQLYSRCKSYHTCPYLGQMSDWFDERTANEYSCCIKIDNGYLPLTQGDHSTFRFSSQLTCDKTGYSGVYVYTIYMYAAQLHLSATGCECKFATDLIGEPEEYDDLEEELLIGGSLFGKFKNWFKSGGPSRLIDKASKIVDVVAPNSGVSQGLNKASQISNILTGSATSIF